MSICRRQYKMPVVQTPNPSPSLAVHSFCKATYNISKRMRLFGEGRMENQVGSLREKHWKS